MITEAFIISDLHLTESPYDEYKWAVFEWARYEITTRELDKLFILGDLFDKKDRHGSELINRLVKEINKCAKLVPVTILKGNHDYLKPEHPYLELLDTIQNVLFIKEPMYIEDMDSWWLPHAKDPEEEWKDIDLVNCNLIFMHQSVLGSVVSNYHEMKSGLSPSFFKGTKAKIFSGDIHVPQNIKIPGAVPLTYIGTPYPVAFGDTYTPRGIILNLDDLNFTVLTMEVLQKLSITINEPEQLTEYEMYEGDQVKITVELEASELSNWSEYKEEIKTLCKENNLILRDLKMKKKETLNRMQKAAGKTSNKFTKMSPIDVLKKFSEIEKLDKDIEKEGLELLK